MLTLSESSESSSQRAPTGQRDSAPDSASTCHRDVRSRYIVTIHIQTCNDQVVVLGQPTGRIAVVEVVQVPIVRDHDKNGVVPAPPCQHAMQGVVNAVHRVAIPLRHRGELNHSHCLERQHRDKRQQQLQQQIVHR